MPCSDGIAVIGASDDDDDGNNSGSAYVFELTGDDWTEVAQLRADDADVRDRFGRAVAVNGRYAVVGSYRDDDNGDASGSAYVFERSDDGWNQTAKLLASDGAAIDHFGRSVAVNGNYIVVGAYRDDEVSDGTGSAYVFERDGDAWTQVTKLTASSPSETSGFGFSAALSDTYAVFGAYNEDDQQNGAYVFEK